MPSYGEWSDLVIALCHLDSNDCTEGDMGDRYDYGYTDNSLLASAFKTSFGITHTESQYWLSSPISNDYARDFNIGDGELYLNDNQGRSAPAYVRCFKDSIVEAQILNYRWQTGSICSSDESDYNSTSRDTYVV